MTMMSPLDLPSAKNLSVKNAVEMFVPTDLYWEVMASDSHDVVFGTRGSGKTMLLRMMSLQHLVEFAKENAEARRVLYEHKRFGLFLPLGIDWCVAYQRNDDESLQLFVDGVNLVAADVLVDALECLLRTDVIALENPDKTERELCEQLVAQWFRPFGNIYSFLSLRMYLLRQQAILRDLWRKPRTPPTDSEQISAGYNFRTSTFLAPIADGVRLVNFQLGLRGDHKWLMCLDELEDFKPPQMRILATLLRSTLPNLVLKITTQPYTLDGKHTDFSEEASAVDFRDFQVKRLQHDPQQPPYHRLVAGILRKRVRARPELSAEQLLCEIFGNNTFVQRAQEVETEFSHLRATIILMTGEKSDSARKKMPVAAIRVLRRDAAGNKNSQAYSGWRTIVNVSDGNPGVFVRMLNELGVGKDTVGVDPVRQHRTLAELATTWHEWSKGLYADGKVLFDLIQSIGNQLSERIHSKKEGDAEIQEEVNRLFVNLHQLDDAHVKAFQVGARHALLVAETADSSLRYPDGEGVWRLSYSLAPKFWLLPRKGRSIQLTPKQLVLPKPKQEDKTGQLWLFELGELEAMARLGTPGGIVEDKIVEGEDEDI